MHIEHVAIWTKNLERLKDFYVHYFQAVAGVSTPIMTKASNPAS